VLTFPTLWRWCFGRLDLVSGVSFHFYLLYFALDQFFDGAKQFNFVGIDERYSLTLAPRASSSANAMDIVF